MCLTEKWKNFYFKLFALLCIRSEHSKLWSSSSGVEDMLFYTITEGKEEVPISYFISVSRWRYIHPFIRTYMVLMFLFFHYYLQALRKTGLHPSDPRLKDCMEKLRQAAKESASEVMMDRDLFHRYDSWGNRYVVWTDEKLVGCRKLTPQQSDMFILEC